MIKKYSELDRTDLTPVWIGNQERGDGSEFACYTHNGKFKSIHTLREQGITPICGCCKQRTACYENGLCSFCEKGRE